jgi:hypothetical protein
MEEANRELIRSLRSPLTVYERTVNADTTKCMLDSKYHGEYDVCTVDASTTLDVLAHLFATTSAKAILPKI